MKYYICMLFLYSNIHYNVYYGVSRGESNVNPSLKSSVTSHYHLFKQLFETCLVPRSQSSIKSDCCVLWKNPLIGVFPKKVFVKRYTVNMKKKTNIKRLQYTPSVTWCHPRTRSPAQVYFALCCRTQYCTFVKVNLLIMSLDRIIEPKCEWWCFIIISLIKRNRSQYNMHTFLRG